MNLLTQTGLCDICGNDRKVGSHMECSKHRQASYANKNSQAKPAQKKRASQYKQFNPTKDRNDQTT